MKIKNKYSWYKKIRKPTPPSSSPMTSKKGKKGYDRKNKKDYIREIDDEEVD